jgi:hypothetical protein
MWGLVIAVNLPVAIALTAALLRRRSPVTVTVFLRWGALIFVSTCTVLIGLLAAAQTIAGPGGWLATEKIMLWLVPLAILSVLAWYRPAWATAALGILLAATAALAIWIVAAPGGWQLPGDPVSPVPDLAALLLLPLPAALVGWRRPLTGAVLLLVLGLAPVAIFALGSVQEMSLAGVGTPPVVAGLLYLLAAVLAHRPARLGHGKIP